MLTHPADSAGPRKRDNGGWPFPALVVETSGPLACFTRPELKAERVSYPVMTPTAAKGLLEAVFWKPEFEYVITAIEVLAPIEWITVRRNEVKSVVTDAGVRKLRGGQGFRYDVEGDRDQRNTVALRDVAYRIHAQIRLRPHATDPVGKYRDQARRRIDRGACFSQPFMGCREFAADFGPPRPGRKPIERTEELGVMLHSIAYQGRREEYGWFRARLERGVLAVPEAPLPADAVAMPAAGWRATADTDDGWR